MAIRGFSFDVMVDSMSASSFKADLASCAQGGFLEPLS